MASLKRNIKLISDGKAPWMTRYGSLESIEGAVKEGKLTAPDFKGKQKALGKSLCTQIRDLRSEIVRQASFTAATLARDLPSLRALSRVLMAGIIEYNTPNKVMQRYVGHAGQVLCKYSAIKPDIIKMLSKKIKGARGAVPQIMCTGYLYVLVDSVDQAFLEEHAEGVGASIVGALQCSKPAARKAGASTARLFATRAASAAEAWLDILEAREPRLAKIVRRFTGDFAPEIYLDMSRLRAASAKTERRVTKLKSGLRKSRKFRRRQGKSGSKKTRKPSLPAVSLDMATLKAYFDAVDVNKDGRVTQYELRRALVKAGLSKVNANKHARDYFKIGDHNKDGFVSASEFISEFVRMQTLCTVKSLHRRFDEIDVDNDHEISREELRKYYEQRVGQEAAGSIVAEIFLVCDVDKSGTLTIDELEDWYVRRVNEIYLSRLAAHKSFLAQSVTVAPGASDSKGASDVKQKRAGNAGLLVLCGPSGVGKGSILRKLGDLAPGGTIGVAVSHTTREPREGEIDGVHYNFVTQDEFAAIEAKGGFIETAKVHGQRYGTSKAAIAAVQRGGGACVAEIDVQGAQQIKASGLGAGQLRFVFVTAPRGLEEIERRLRGRNTETEDKIKLRLATSAKELEFLAENGKFFDKVLVNDDLGKAARELLADLERWFPDAMV